MNLLSKIIREAVENSGEIEIRIRIGRDTTVGELQEKIPILLSIFPPDTIQVVPIKQLSPKEEQEILEMAMSDYEDEDKSLVEIQGEVYEDRS